MLWRVDVVDVVEQELNIVAVHPLTGRQIPIFVVASRQYGEYNDVDLGKAAVLRAYLSYII